MYVRDTPEKEKDSRVASHILEIHRDAEHAAQPAIDIDLFSKYLAFSKQIEPELTTEAIEIIQKLLYENEKCGFRRYDYCYS